MTIEKQLEHFMNFFEIQKNMQGICGSWAAHQGNTKRLPHYFPNAHPMLAMPHNLPTESAHLKCEISPIYYKLQLTKMTISENNVSSKCFDTKYTFKHFLLLQKKIQNKKQTNKKLKKFFIFFFEKIERTKLGCYI